MDLVTIDYIRPVHYSKSLDTTSIDGNSGLETTEDVDMIPDFKHNLDAAYASFSLV
jgi:hypothetical protein